MMKKSSAHYQRLYRQRLRDQGLVKKEVWILPGNAAALAAYEKQLRLPSPPQGIHDKDVPMSNASSNIWSTASLCAALQSSALCADAAAKVELIGDDSTLRITLYDFGDLPVFLTVVGEQVIVETTLCAASSVRDRAAFNDAILRTHKYFPLSTICLDTASDGSEYYQMFGALSATSRLDNVIFEIDTLAVNVINATQAYDELSSGDES